MSYCSDTFWPHGTESTLIISYRFLDTSCLYFKWAFVAPFNNNKNLSCVLSYLVTMAQFSSSHPFISKLPVQVVAVQLFPFTWLQSLGFVLSLVSAWDTLQGWHCQKSEIIDSLLTTPTIPQEHPQWSGCPLNHLKSVLCSFLGVNVQILHFGSSVASSWTNEITGNCLQTGKPLFPSLVLCLVCYLSPGLSMFLLPF